MEPADAFLPAGWQRLPRLLTLTTFMQRDTTIAEAVRALRLSTGARLVVEGSEALPAHVSLYYRNVPLADVLRGMAAARNLVWVKTDAGELLLRPRRQAHALDVFHPHTEAEAEMWRKGQELVKQAMALPPELQQELQQSTTTSLKFVPNGAAFADLPPAMRQTAQAMYAARVQMLHEEGSDVRVAPDDLSSMRLRMNVDVQQSATHYGFLVSGSGASESMWTRAFHDPKEGSAVVP